MRISILLIAVMLAGAAGGQSFTPGVDGTWSFVETDGLCLLEQPVRDFGTVRFVGAPGAPLRLEVLGHREIFADGGIGLWRVTPPWHPGHPAHELLGRAEQRTGSSVLIDDPLATQVLMALYRGYEAHVQHAAWYGGEADIRIGNEHLRPRYEAFARCRQSATAAGWSSFERTRIEYSSNVAGFGEDDQERLRSVAAYVLADPAVTEVYVDGHTDDVGSRESNVFLSRRRAEAVAEYLASCGVPREQLVVRYHGAQYPVVAEPTETARAENRRTTVRLERRSPNGEVANR